MCFHTGHTLYWASCHHMGILLAPLLCSLHQPAGWSTGSHCLRDELGSFPVLVTRAGGGGHALAPPTFPHHRLDSGQNFQGASCSNSGQSRDQIPFRKQKRWGSAWRSGRIPLAVPRQARQRPLVARMTAQLGTASRNAHLSSWGPMFGYFGGTLHW